MWTDHLIVSFFSDDNVKMKREVTSPATPDQITLTFSDGSELFFRVNANLPEGINSELEATEMAANTTAVKVFGKLVEAVYNHATEINLDLDI